MSVKNLSGYSVTKYRAIMFHGKHSMRDMNLMMIGSTPLSQVTPKIVREEVAYGDGDLDLSRLDGSLFFNSRTITYTFALVDELSDNARPVANNARLIERLSEIYKWLYQDFVPYQSKTRDIIDWGDDTPFGYVGANEMFDSAYNPYKFTNATVTDMKVSKAMFEGAWVESLEITFTCDPYMQTFTGSRVEIATYADRAVMGSRNIQTQMMVFNNHQYYLNDFSQWCWDNYGVHLTDTKWRFRIPVPYSGKIGFWLAPTATWNDVTYEIDKAYGQTTTLHFLDNDHSSSGITSRKGGYGYVTPTTDTAGRKIIDIVVEFVESWTVENPPHIYIEWGVLRDYTVPDQNHYYMDAYTKSNSATMYVNGTETEFSEPFSLESRPLNEIHIRNLEYDGLYKFRFDTTTRRL